MEVIKKLTPYNYTAMQHKKNEYIVIHYVGAVSTAKNNADYLYNNCTSASAHYFVDENDIYQVVEDKNKAWHCGGGLQSNLGHTFYGKCTNSNSIGVELCCKIKNGDEWYFEDKTVENAAWLIRYLMDKHNIPIDRVIRHFDVTGKNCPAPYIDDIEWAKFKSKLTGGEAMTQEEQKNFNALVDQVENLTKQLEKATMVYNYFDENFPEWAKSTVQKAIDKGIVKGTENGLGLTMQDIKSLCFLERLGVL